MNKTFLFKEITFSTLWDSDGGGGGGGDRGSRPHPPEKNMNI